MEEIAVHNVHKKMQDDLAVYGAIKGDIAYCPHKPHAKCECRKPKMISDLAEKYGIDLEKTI